VSSADLHALADERLDELIDEDEWQRHLAAHGPTLDAALTTARERRAAIAALPRETMPAALRDQIASRLHDAAAEQRRATRPSIAARKRWAPLVPVLLAAGLTLLVLPLVVQDDPEMQLREREALYGSSTEAPGQDHHAAADVAAADRHPAAAEETTGDRASGSSADKSDDQPRLAQQDAQAGGGGRAGAAPAMQEPRGDAAREREQHSLADLDMPTPSAASETDAVHDRADSLAGRRSAARQIEREDRADGRQRAEQLNRATAAKQDELAERESPPLEASELDALEAQAEQWRRERGGKAADDGKAETNPDLPPDVLRAALLAELRRHGVDAAQQTVAGRFEAADSQTSDGSSATRTAGAPATASDSESADADSGAATTTTLALSVGMGLAPAADGDPATLVLALRNGGTDPAPSLRDRLILEGLDDAGEALWRTTLPVPQESGPAPGAVQRWQVPLHGPLEPPAGTAALRLRLDEQVGPTLPID